MISSQEFKTICRMIKELETRLDDRLDGFGRKFIGMLQGFSILDPDKQTMTSERSVSSTVSPTVSSAT